MDNYNLDTLAESERLSAWSEAQAPAPRRIRLWLVDDNDEVRRLFGDVFRGQADFDCEREFGSTATAIEALRREPAPDVILLDLHLGEENGLDAIRPMKLLAPGADVIMLTTFNDPASAARASAEGASGFLLKTYDPQEIVRLVRAAQEGTAVAGLFPEFRFQPRPAAPRAVGGSRLSGPAPAPCRSKQRSFFRNFLNVFTF